MTETLGTLLFGMVIGAIGAAGLLVWIDRRRMDDAVAEAAEADQQAQRPIWRPGRDK